MIFAAIGKGLQVGGAAVKGIISRAKEKRAKKKAAKAEARRVEAEARLAEGFESLKLPDAGAVGKKFKADMPAIQQKVTQVADKYASTSAKIMPYVLPVALILFLIYIFKRK